MLLLTTAFFLCVSLAVRQDETVWIGSGIPGADFIQFPNPFYGQGTIFQYPSSLRLGIKFQF